MTHQALIDKLTDLIKKANKPMLNVEECADYTGYSVSTLRTMCNKRLIPHYKHMGRLIFDRKEVTEWLHLGRVATDDEIDRKASRYKVLKGLQ